MARRAQCYTSLTMALFTGKGDDGRTKTFGCDQRISKSSAISEALGSLDEATSFLGMCKTHPDASRPLLEGKTFADMIDWAQGNLFIVQAHVAGSADKTIAKEKISHMEAVVEAMEKDMPPITTFFVPGGTPFSAHLDVARTLARRAERRVVAVSEEGGGVDSTVLTFLNRLSSVLYALARLANHRSGITEQPPEYR